VEQTNPISSRDYWFCQSVGWGTLTLFSVISSSFGSLHAALQFALAKLFVMASGLGLSHLWRSRLRREGWLVRPNGFPYARIGAGLLLLAIAQTVCLLLSDKLFRGGAFFDDTPAMLAFNVGLLVFMWLMIFAVWTLCYAVALARRRAGRFEFEKLRLEVSVKDAELRALQAQVNPHFFFNSLNSIRALTYENADAAARAIGQLAGMMRYSLQAGQQPLLPLHEELAAVRSYLEMEKLRFDERLALHVEVGAELGATLLPPMVLQTLAENAVRHGVERSSGPCRIEIRARRVDGAVEVEVANQGRLAPDSSSTRLGLSNARERLALQCGPGAGIALAESEGWVRACLRLPQTAAALESA
jgi:hypothetical protein